MIRAVTTEIAGLASSSLYAVIVVAFRTIAPFVRVTRAVNAGLRDPGSKRPLFHCTLVVKSYGVPGLLVFPGVRERYVGVVDLERKHPRLINRRIIVQQRFVPPSVNWVSNKRDLHFER